MMLDVVFLEKKMSKSLDIFNASILGLVLVVMLQDVSYDDINDISRIDPRILTSICIYVDIYIYIYIYR